jgi:hypothetical protein
MTASAVTTSATQKDIPHVPVTTVKYVPLAPEKPSSHYVVPTDS